jgi:hypothetical protein
MLVAWSAGTLGNGPSDIVQGALPLTGFAMQTVGRIGRLDLAMNGFIDSRGTEGDAGIVKHRRTFRPA